MLLDDVLKQPVVNKILIDYLNENFNIDTLLSKHGFNNDSEKIGYIKGIREIIGHLEYLNREGGRTS